MASTDGLRSLRSMDDIDSLPTLHELFTDGKASSTVERPFRPLAHLGPNGIRGSALLTDNTIKQIQLNKPTALLYPQQVRDGPAAGLIESTQRAQLFSVVTMKKQGPSEKTLSELGAFVRSLVCFGPEDSCNGMFSFDLRALVDSPNFGGESLLSFFLKGWLYCLTLQHSVRSLSNSEPGLFDSWTQLAPSPTVTLGLNDGLTFNSACGGFAKPVFPYALGAPTISFHVSLSSVPYDATFFFVSSSLLSAGELDLAMLALLIAPYPCGIHTVTISTLDDQGGRTRILILMFAISELLYSELIKQHKECPNKNPEMSG